MSPAQYAVLWTLYILCVQEVSPNTIYFVFLVQSPCLLCNVVWLLFGVSVCVALPRRASERLLFVLHDPLPNVGEARATFFEFYLYTCSFVSVLGPQVQGLALHCTCLELCIFLPPILSFSILGLERFVFE